MDHWNSDLVLNIVQYLNVRDAGALCGTSRRYLYLVKQYRHLRGAELVAVRSHDPAVRTRQLPAQEVCKRAVDGLQAPPNLALAFNTYSSTFADTLAAHLPPETIVLGSTSSSIQTSMEGGLEYRSNAGLMLGNLSGARIRPFTFDTETQNIGSDLEAFRDSLLQEAADWSVFMIYACGDAGDEAEFVVETLQEYFPDAAIVGGVCGSGYISMPRVPETTESLSAKTSIDLLQMNRCLGGPSPGPGIDKSELVQHVLTVLGRKKYILNSIESGGVFGIALGGDVPVRSVVSRGVKSMTYKGEAQPTTPFFVSDAELFRSGDPGYMFRGTDPPPYHLVRAIENRETGKTYSPIELLMTYGISSLCGIRRPNEDGFELLTPHPVSMNMNVFLFIKTRCAENETSLIDANFDLFEIDGEACVSDMQKTMQRLEAQTQGEEILGAVMYSCSGRGPNAGSLISEEMADAKRFSKVFPNIPCLGFYAGGEIGPLALAGRRAVFQTGQATLQGFTAVFAVFIVPVEDLTNMHIDDCDENIQAFMETVYSGGSKHTGTPSPSKVPKIA